MSTPVVIASAASAPGAGSLLATLFALAVVLGLVVGLGWLLKRLPGGLAQHRSGLRVVASLAVGAKERVLVVEAGERQLLIGVTSQQISLLDTLAQPLPETPPAASFAAVLARQQRAMAAPWTLALARRIADTPTMRRFGMRARRWAPVQALAARFGAGASR